MCETGTNGILPNDGRDLVYLYQVPSQTSVKIRAGYIYIYALEFVSI